MNVVNRSVVEIWLRSIGVFFWFGLLNRVYIFVLSFCDYLIGFSEFCVGLFFISVAAITLLRIDC